MKWVFSTGTLKYWASNWEMEVLQPGQFIRPDLTHEQALKLAEKLYGLKDYHLTEFECYDDRSYYLKKMDGKRDQNEWQHGYVLKVMNTLDSKKLNFVEAQNEVMLFLSKQGIKCPQPVKNVNGKYYSVEKIFKQDNAEEFQEHVVRLLLFQPGKILYDVPCTGKLFYQAGYYVADLNCLLKNFKHPAFESHKTQWMLEQVPSLKKFLYAVSDPQRLAIVQEVIQKFTEEVTPKIDTMEKGLIHGDFNEHNILVEQSDGEWNICGVLDFGDCNISCYVFELAITMCYMMLQSKQLHPVEAGGHVIAGFTTKRPIPDTEFQLLKLCVCARLCQSLVMGAYTYSLDPGNEYLLVTAANGWKLLQDLWNIPDHEMFARWKTVMASYSAS